MSGTTSSKSDEPFPARYVQPLRFIAEGWGSRVYSTLLRHEDGRELPVVVKRLKAQLADHNPAEYQPHLIEAMVREALALSACTHDRVPRFVEWLWVGTLPCVVMESLPGETLAALLRVHRQLSWPAARQVVLGILDILEQVHATGWLHCDINPGNILVHATEVYLVDFGAAQRPGLPPRWRWPLGRHRYMAPEHLLSLVECPGYGRLSPASDLHQVACLLAFLLVGKEAFRRSQPEEDYATDYLRRLGRWMARPVQEKLCQLSVEDSRKDIPSGLDPILGMALHPDPQQRYQSAGQMRRAIESLGG